MKNKNLNKFLTTALAFTVAIVIYKWISNKKKPEAPSSNDDLVQGPHTSFSGTSESILNDLDEHRANELKEELQ